MHLYFDIALGLWGVVVFLVAYFIGRATRPQKRKNAAKVSGLSRAEQHAFDAAHNPNYRGARRPDNG